MRRANHFTLSREKISLPPPSSIYKPFSFHSPSSITCALLHLDAFENPSPSTRAPLSAHLPLSTLPASFWNQPPSTQPPLCVDPFSTNPPPSALQNKPNIRTGSRADSGAPCREKNHQNDCNSGWKRSISVRGMLCGVERQWAAWFLSNMCCPFPLLISVLIHTSARANFSFLQSANN